MNIKSANRQTKMKTARIWITSRCHFGRRTHVWWGGKLAKLDVSLFHDVSWYLWCCRRSGFPEGCGESTKTFLRSPSFATFPTFDAPVSYFFWQFPFLSSPLLFFSSLFCFSISVSYCRKFNGMIYKITNVENNACYIGSICESLSKTTTRRREEFRAYQRGSPHYMT